MYLPPQESDYLHLIHHLYDSDSSESEVEEEKAKRERLARLHNKLQSVTGGVCSILVQFLTVD